MKIIIAGSRTIKDRQAVIDAVHRSGIVGQITELVHGACPTGVDAIAHSLFEGVVPIKTFPADWNKYGRSAGPIRNAEMAKYADALIVVWDGKSAGSKSMIQCMKVEGKPVHETVVKERVG